MGVFVNIIPLTVTVHLLLDKKAICHQIAFNKANYGMTEVNNRKQFSTFCFPKQSQISSAHRIVL